MVDTLLIIEDEPLLGTELKRHYRRQGWEVVRTDSLKAAEKMLLGHEVDPLVVLSDMNLPDGNALTLLEKVRSIGVASEWIFLTGYGSVPDSVHALRLGAFDFLEKPCEQERLDLVIAGAARGARAQRRIQDQTSAQTRKYVPASFAGRSAAAHHVRELINKLTQVPFSALIISGETGTGKGLVARILHHGSARAQGPMVEINCAALPRELLESELFGHEAGAFTGAKGRRRGLLEQADGGTLFLDEIGDMDLELQAKLLKAIEDRRVRRLGGDSEISVDVQVLAATHRNLEDEVKKGHFRGDLYHRLSVFQLHLPALRSRKEDLDELVPLIIAEYNVKAAKSVKIVPNEAWERLRAHDWPGNVRELRNVIERCVLFSDGEMLPHQWLQLTRPDPAENTTAEVTGDRLCLPLDGSMALDDMDRYIIQTALERSSYNVTAASRALGATRETLRYRIQKYGLKPLSG